jgi:hypothetical protein
MSKYIFPLEQFKEVTATQFLDLNEVSEKINSVNSNDNEFIPLPNKYDFNEIGVQNFTKEQH